MRIILMVLMLWVCGYSTTYYIDYATGSDANNGTSKETPWKHAPGMNGSSGNVASYESSHSNAQGTAPAGDRFIFKGGVTWPNDCYGWDWIYGGGTGWTVGTEAVYFGVDQTWYTGGSWTRPIFDAEGEMVSDNRDVTHTMLRIYKGVGGYFIVDNLEFTGLYLLDNTETFMLNMQHTIFEVKNCYFHGWGHGPVVNTGPCSDLGDGVTYTICNRWTSGANSGSYVQDQFRVIAGPYGSDADDARVHHCIIDGSDASPSPGDMGAATKGYFNHFYNNYITQTQNVITSNFCDYVWGNTFVNNSRITKLGSDVHSNLYQSYGGLDRVSFVYNNMANGTGGGATFLWYPTNTTRFYCFNNVIYNDSNLVVQLGNTQLTTNENNAGYFIFNNTFECVSTNNWAIINGSPSGHRFHDFFIKNNHLIASLKTIQAGVNSGEYMVEGGNIFQNRVEAEADGFSKEATSPLFPDPTSATVGSGESVSMLHDSIVDLGPSTPSVAVLYDAAIGVLINETNHTVSYPFRTPVLRGITLDAGAYYSASGVVSKIKLKVFQVEK